MKNNKLIYLATPYTASEPWLREVRERLVTAVAAKLTKKGIHVFSPITESFQYSRMETLPGGWEYWEEKDTLLVYKCDEVWVLKLRGWKQSKGVIDEIKIAKAAGIPVKYLDPAAVLPGYNQYMRNDLHEC